MRISQFSFYLHNKYEPICKGSIVVVIISYFSARRQQEIFPSTNDIPSNKYFQKTDLVFLLGNSQPKFSKSYSNKCKWYNQFNYCSSTQAENLIFIFENGWFDLTCLLPAYLPTCLLSFVSSSVSSSLTFFHGLFSSFLLFISHLFPLFFLSYFPLIFSSPFPYFSSFHHSFFLFIQYTFISKPLFPYSVFFFFPVHKTTLWMKS